jgi:hypothetical protein
VKLYHGTSAKAASRILRRGIEPRGKRRSEWDCVDFPSRTDCVYLTNAYAPYFAINATNGGSTLCAVIEIDTFKLNPFNFVPDEDCLTQYNRQFKPEWDIKQRTAYFREKLHEWAGDYEKSIQAMGNCAHLGKIPLEALTRIAYFDTKLATEFSWASVDPSISILNYQNIGQKYRGLTKWLFGDDLGDDAPKKIIPDEQWAAFKEGLPERGQYDWFPPSHKNGIKVEVINCYV